MIDVIIITNQISLNKRFETLFFSWFYFDTYDYEKDQWIINNYFIEENQKIIKNCFY